MADEKKEKKDRVKFEDLPYEEKVKTLDKEIKRTDEYLKRLKKALPKTKTKLESLKNLKKAVMYDEITKKKEENKEE